MTPLSPLHTDQYTLTMSQSYWQRGTAEDRCSFELFVRTPPPGAGFVMAAGLQDALAYLQGLAFDADDLAALQGLGIFSEEFLGHLAGLRFTGEVWAAPEGTCLPAGAPLLRVTAPRAQATIAESALLSIINHQSGVATAAALIARAAGSSPVHDFSLRRQPGPDAAVAAARAAYLAGFAGTATVAAGVRHGIPTVGTMAHAYVMSYGPGSERQAFEDFLADYPQAGVLLVDTYDAMQGVRHAIAASQACGIPLKGIRLDSGDLAAQAFEARELLDAAGMAGALIFATNDLDAARIAALKGQGAPIDAYGVGTMLARAVPCSGVYKSVAEHHLGAERPFMKLADGKTSDPGTHQVFRSPAGEHTLTLGSELPDGLPLLAPVMKAGVPFGPAPSLPASRAHAAAELAALPAGALDGTAPLQLARSRRLWELRAQLGDPSAALHLQLAPAPA